MRPLDDITVAELGGRYAVGACGSLLAHLGAKVLYVEADDLPGDKWAHRSTFALGKEPLAADKRAAAINRADIILTSSDIDGDTTLFEESIHIDITAFGHSGPLAGKPYSDALVQALTGVADTNGQEGGRPFAAGAPILEYEAAIYAAAAAVGAGGSIQGGSRTAARTSCRRPAGGPTASPAATAPARPSRAAFLVLRSKWPRWP